VNRNQPKLTACISYGLILASGAPRQRPPTTPTVRKIWQRWYQKPKRIIADRGYDSDPLRERFKERGIELIAPYRNNNNLRRYDDVRKVHRYKRRWIVERTNAWLGQFR
jgi:transposase